MLRHCWSKLHFAAVCQDLLTLLCESIIRAFILNVWVFLAQSISLAERLSEKEALFRSKLNTYAYTAGIHLCKSKQTAELKNRCSVLPFVSACGLQRSFSLCFLLSCPLFFLVLYPVGCFLKFHFLSSPLPEWNFCLLSEMWFMPPLLRSRHLENCTQCRAFLCPSHFWWKKLQKI